MKILTPNRAKNCLIIFLVIIAILVLYNISLKIYPKLFPTEENLNIKEWSTYTEYWGNKPFYTIKYPKGWLITKKCGGGGFPCINIYSPWNVENNIDKSFVHIQLTWADTDYSWGGTDPLLGSIGDQDKIAMTKDNFIENKIDSFKALSPKIGVMRDNDVDNVYIFTSISIFDSPQSKLVFRFKLIYDTNQNSEKIKKIYYQIVNSFNYLE